jgi:hypothetical protein
VVAENLAQRLLVCGRKHGSDLFEGFVSRHEDGEIRDVEASEVGAGFSEGKVQVCGLERGVHGEVASAVGEELEGSAEGEDGVDFVNGDAFAEFDVLLIQVRGLLHENVGDEMLTAWVTVEMVCSPDKMQTSFPFFTSPLY